MIGKRAVQQSSSLRHVNADLCFRQEQSNKSEYRVTLLMQNGTLRAITASCKEVANGLG